MRLFDGAVEHVARGLAYAARRHEVLAKNLANVETPGYRARDLVFDDVLSPLLGAAAPEPPPDLPPVGRAERRPRLVLVTDGPPNAQGNDVKLDRQMARLAENTLFHHMLAQVLGNRLSALKQAITGRV